MKELKRLTLALAALASVVGGATQIAHAADTATTPAPARDGSIYTMRPDDPEAFYFTPENYDIAADGRTDVTDELQRAIYELKTAKAFGILFIPEGKYLISKTVHVPSSIRLIGYGRKRPEIVLGRNTPGFQSEQNYMIWFTGGMPRPDGSVQDAGAGTFYSALSNIDMRIERGNPSAVAIRSHFAQHGFISHSDLNIGEGFAGIYDVGNEIENVRFFGGEYGITSGRTSPGWPMMMVDTRFEGQRRAAITSREVGFNIINMQVRGVPVGIEMADGRADRLHIENSWFENISKAAITVGVEENSFSQLNIINLSCRNVPTLVHYTQSGTEEKVPHATYIVKDYTYGTVLKDMATPSETTIIRDIEPLARFAPATVHDIPALPAMETWANVRDFGAVGDGTTDDTEAFRAAIAAHKNVYVPQGWYRVTSTIKMAPGTALIGLHPFGTQIIIAESTPAFSGFGAPVAVVESSEGGDDILNGIGISTGGYNYRAVGAKWMASERSLMNDVKLVGGHGTIRKPNPTATATPRQRQSPSISSPDSPVATQGLDLAWDNQYWSLWITRGGGTIKDIWTASTYAASGLYISNTDTPGRIYAMSLEHHVRTEARLENVANWKIYAYQFEEEGREGKDSRMMELSNCRDVMFAGVWMYRVIRGSTPKEIGIGVWNSERIQFRNMHNYTQILPVIEIPAYDINKRLPVYDWDFARLDISGNEPSKRAHDGSTGAINKLAEGFEFAAGLTADSRGNVYFGENRLKKIYKWDAAKGALSLLTDYPWKPFTLATDTEDNLLVIFRYDPQPGFMVDGEQEKVGRLPDDNPMYSGWGNSGWAALGYSIDPDDPDETFAPLRRIATKDARDVRRVIHPASRWRGDFDKVVVSMAPTSFVAPDGVTIIPETYDLGRSAALFAVTPGQTQPAYVAHENNKTTVKLQVAADGSLSKAEQAFPHGQYSSTTDREGNVYVADGEIFVYTPAGELSRRISLDERPISVVVGGADFKTLFVTTTRSLYGIEL
ncbi:MAG: SMP-30/gluconolactonase/LRE family protein [Alistipes sp.]|jgi:hypothetical protein|nr:SMP-30/gluconolactonase/LRE family protein [Alistipes sp.]